jgi:hypothetical protein
MNSTPGGWMIDKRVQISHILGTLILCLTGLFYVTDTRKEVDILKSKQEIQSAVDMSQDQNVKDAARELREQLRRIDDKLDRIIERGK